MPTATSRRARLLGPIGLMIALVAALIVLSPSPAEAVRRPFPTAAWGTPLSPAKDFEDWGFDSCNPPYYENNAHLGADSQGSSAGDAVYAMGSGTVSKIVASNWGPGGAIGIEHTAGDGTRFLAVYGHVVTIQVSVGAHVSAGQQIANLYDWGGNSHLHLGVKPLAPGESPNQALWGSEDCASTAPAPTHGFVDPIPWLSSHPAGPSGPIALVDQVWSEAPSGWYVQAPVNLTFTVKNTTGSAVRMKPFILALRDPYGSNYDQLCSADTTLAAGATTTCTTSNRWGSVGTYRIWPAWADTGGAWHSIAGESTFALSAQPPIFATEPVTASALSGWYTQAPVTNTFTVKNTTGSAIRMKPLILALRDPYGSNYDQLCSADITLAPGATKTCTSSNSWGSVGTYKMWPAWAETGGAWHNVAPESNFTLAAPPPILATVPVTTTAPTGYYVKAVIRHTFTVKNTTGSPIRMKPFVLALRDPYGSNYDQVCSADVTLAAGASTTCMTSNRWGSVGTYKIWPAWADTGGGWHSIAPESRFTLKADTTAPTTAMLKPSGGSTTARTVPVTWSGSDIGAGIKSYTLATRSRSVSSTTWSAWRIPTDWNTLTTTHVASVPMKIGRRYCFRVKALDYAGNWSTYSTGKCVTRTG